MNGVVIGSKIRIVKMEGEDAYAGRVGVITSIDDEGQIHGTWGGLAINPSVDAYEVIKDGKRCGHGRMEITLNLKGLNGFKLPNAEEASNVDTCELAVYFDGITLHCAKGDVNVFESEGASTFYTFEDVGHNTLNVYYSIDKVSYYEGEDYPNNFDDEKDILIKDLVSKQDLSSSTFVKRLWMALRLNWVDKDYRFSNDVDLSDEVEVKVINVRIVECNNDDYYNYIENNVEQTNVEMR